MIDKTLLICHIDKLEEPGSRGFSLEFNGDLIEGFVVQNDGGYFAYRNSCPHTGSPLDWVEHQFLDLDGALIQCAVHDARFIIETGECIAGPCVTESLEKIDIEVKNNNIYFMPQPKII